MRRNTLPISVLCVSLAVLVGCGDDDGVPPTDSGSGDPDAGPGIDSGRVDSGGGVDAGDDAGDGDDAGSTDAGGGSDAGTDAGSETARPITFAESCPPFAPCGGDLVGSWRYDGVCVTHAEVEAEFDDCPEASFISGTGSVDGTVSFDGTTVERDGTTAVSIVVNVPSTCTMGFACSLVGPVIQSMAMVDSVTCADAADGCDCTVMDSETISESDPYTTSGNTFENSTSTRRWDYCVDGTDLTVREIASGGGDDPVEPGIQALVSEG